MRVGTRDCRLGGNTIPEDHPHACGDKERLFKHQRCIKGSSPCVWGQALSRTSQTRLTRIIPMRVGTSHEKNNRSRFHRDHPHACGDKINPFLHLVSYQGSSPCVWGQGYLQYQLATCFGIIPMRVGTRLVSSLGFPIAWDHPHACGDKYQYLTLQGID